MRFREYVEVKPVTLAARTPRGLDRQIEVLGGKCDIIDLQFASRTLACGEPEYSALALVRAAGREAGKTKDTQKENQPCSI